MASEPLHFFIILTIYDLLIVFSSHFLPLHISLVLYMSVLSASSAIKELSKH